VPDAQARTEDDAFAGDEVLDKVDRLLEVREELVVVLDVAGVVPERGEAVSGCWSLSADGGGDGEGTRRSFFVSRGNRYRPAFSSSGGRGSWAISEGGKTAEGANGSSGRATSTGSNTVRSWGQSSGQRRMWARGSSWLMTEGKNGRRQDSCA
jgi:hypothetical protein